MELEEQKTPMMALVSYVWQVVIGSKSMEKTIMILTEDPVPGIDFSVIVKLHARAFATDHMLATDDVTMKSATLLGRAYGSTKATDSLKDPEMRVGANGEVLLSDDLVERVKNLSSRLERGYPSEEAQQAAHEEAENTYAKWRRMAFTDKRKQPVNLDQAVSVPENKVVGSMTPNEPKEPADEKTKTREIEIRFCSVCNAKVETFVDADNECPTCHVTSLRKIETPHSGEQG